MFPDINKAPLLLTKSLSPVQMVGAAGARPRTSLFSLSLSLHFLFLNATSAICHPALYFSSLS